MNKIFTLSELLIIRHAMRIAMEDGSIYTDDDDNENEKVNRLKKKIDKLVIQRIENE